jgi:ribose/xylose/arabinose/galactoside ABC-type transport system permease subunit
MDRAKIMPVIQKLFRNYAMVFIFAGLFLVFSIVNPSFCSWMNIKNLIVQNTYIVVTAVGISFVMMSGALDLSVGYQVAAIGVLTARLMTLEQVPVLPAVIISLLFAIFLGLINGGISVLFKIEPLIVTIATMTIFRGMANIISKGLSYNNFPDSFRIITRGAFFGIPVDVYIAVLAVVLASVIYNFTYYGRFVKAMGGNEEATRLAGVNIALMRISTFVISGAFVAIASFIYISKLSTTNATYGPGIEFTGMTAAILGGISFNSGEGKMWGLVVGIFTLAIIENGMQLGGLNQYIQYIVKGSILILAIAFDKYQRTISAQKKSA